MRINEHGVRMLDTDEEVAAHLSELEAQGHHHVADVIRRALAAAAAPTPPFEYLGTDAATGKSIFEFESESDAYTYADLMISFGSSAELYEVKGRQVHLNLPMPGTK